MFSWIHIWKGIWTWLFPKLFEAPTFQTLFPSALSTFQGCKRATSPQLLLVTPSWGCHGCSCIPARGVDPGGIWAGLWGHPWGQGFEQSSNTAWTGRCQRLPAGFRQQKLIFNALSKGYSTGLIFPHLLLRLKVWMSPTEGEKQILGIFAEEKALSAAEGPEGLGLSWADSGSVHWGASCLKMQHSLLAPCHPLRKAFFFWWFLINWHHHWDLQMSN